jgi:ABC transporter substrate binding protein
MVRLKVDIIVVTTTPAALAVKSTTKTIPVVFPTAIDPVASGVVASLARPGGNITGLTIQAPALVGKRRNSSRKRFRASPGSPCSGMRPIRRTRALGEKRRMLPVR